IGWDAGTVVLYFHGETVVRAGYPDRNTLCARMFARVADGLLPAAVFRDRGRCRQHREFTSHLEVNGRRTLRAHHRAEFGVLLKGSQEAPMIQGWWSKSFHQAAALDV